MLSNNSQPKSLCYRKCDSCLRTFKTARGLKLHAKKSGQFSQCYRNNDVTVKASKIKSAEVRKNEAKAVKPSKVSLTNWDGAISKGTKFCKNVKTICLNILQVSAIFNYGSLKEFQNLCEKRVTHPHTMLQNLQNMKLRLHFVEI